MVQIENELFDVYDLNSRVGNWYEMKSRGPMWLPCGRPEVILKVADFHPRNLHTQLDLINNLIQSKRQERTPTSFLFSKM